jgi:uncharacterized DUF497 family protein
MICRCVCDTAAQAPLRNYASVVTLEVLLLVVFVDRSEPGVEIIHIISARKAVAYEQSTYEDQFR